MNKVAITKNGYDIARIILFNNNNLYYEVKVTFFIDNYNIELLKAFHKKSVLTEVNGKMTEITWHLSNDNQNNKIHLKIDKKYHTLIEDNLLDLNEQLYIPTPLIKFIFPDDMKLTKIYKPKDNHRSVDLNEDNIFELYLYHNDMNDEDFLLHRYLMFEVYFPFEYFITNSLHRYDSKVRHLSTLKGGKIHSQPIFMISPNIHIYTSKYRDDYIKIDKMRVVIGENKYSQIIYLLLGLMMNRIYPVNRNMIKYYQEKKKERSMFLFEILLEEKNFSSHLIYKIRRDSKKAIETFLNIAKELELKDNEYYKDD